MQGYPLNHAQPKQRDPNLELTADFGSEGWIPAQIPGIVHQALLQAGLIPDPFYDLNELEVQWVGERDWLYKLEFAAPQEWQEAGGGKREGDNGVSSFQPSAVLCFD